MSNLNNQTNLTISDYKSLLRGANLYGSGDANVTGISRDTRHVEAGDLFICIRGEKHDSHRYAAQALSRGAVALVIDANELEAVRQNSEIPADTPILAVKNTRWALPLIACAFYGNPSQSMKIIGITGTNGKTTSTMMVAAILRAAGMRVGTIGTLGADLDGVPIQSDHTTPEADQLQALLHNFKMERADAVVMEVSSHALAMHRTDGIAFSVGMFTNLSLEHLDYHGNMENYFDAKARLFAEYPISYPRKDGSTFIAIITISQWEGRELVTLARGDILTFATDDSPAVLRAENPVLTAESTSFTVQYDSGVERYSFDVRLPIGGAFQIGNALGSIGACLRLGVPASTVATGLASMQGVPGRFEAVPTDGLDFSLIVDYAHTSDGLDNLLRSASELRPTKLIVVFGCGGNRDRTKRPIMGALAATKADIAIVTSDNPRHEDPNFIISEIVAGIEGSTGERRAEIHVEPDRRKAIELALSLSVATPGSLVLIAGKGHETYQLVGDDVLDFDDRAVARELIVALVLRAGKS